MRVQSCEKILPDFLTVRVNTRMNFSYFRGYFTCSVCNTNFARNSNFLYRFDAKEDSQILLNREHVSRTPKRLGSLRHFVCFMYGKKSRDWV